MKNKVKTLLYAVAACLCVWLGLISTKNQWIVWLLAAVCVVRALMIWCRESNAGKKDAIKKQNVHETKETPGNTDVADNQTSPGVQRTQSAAHAYSFVSFNLSGVTFPNDEGVNRQELLHKMDKGLPPFENSDDLEVNLKPIQFGGEDAIECRVNGHQIGFVPKAMVPKVLAAMKMPDATISGVEVVGGTRGKYYGLSMAVRYTDPQKGNQ